MLVNPFSTPNPNSPDAGAAPLSLGEAGIRPLGTPIGGAPDLPQVSPAPENTQGIKKFGNLSAFLGGGAYNIGKTPEEIIKSTRDLQDSFAGRAKVRGGYTGKAVGIDHIIPIGLGGQDSLDNIQLLPKAKFDQKTIVDDLAIFLQKQGKISLAQARNLNKNWDNNPRALLDVEALKADPELSKNIDFGDGTSFNIHEALDKLPKDVSSVGVGDVAKEILTEGPRLAGNAFFNFFKGAADVANKYIGSPLYGLGQGILRGKNVWDETKNYANLVDSGKMAEATGIQNPFDPNTNIGLEVPKGALKALSFGLLRPDTPDYGSDTKNLVGKGLNVLGGGIGTVLGFKALEDLGAKYLPKIPGITPVFNAIKGTSIGKAINASPYVKNLLTSAGVFGAQGQISIPFTTSLENRAEQLKHDVVNAFIFSTTSGIVNAKLPPVKSGAFSPTNISLGTLANMYAGYVTSRMDGADRQDSALNALVFGMLHGYGLAENKLALQSEIQAQKSAIGKFRQMGVFGRIETRSQIDEAVNQATKNIAGEVNNGAMSHAEAIPLFQDIVVASKFLNRQNIPVRTRIKSDLADMASVFMKSRESKKAAKTTALAASQNSFTIDAQSQQYFDELQKSKPPVPTVNEIRNTQSLETELNGPQVSPPQPQIPVQPSPLKPEEILPPAPITKVSDTANVQQPKQFSTLDIAPETTQRFMAVGTSEKIDTLTNSNNKEFQKALATGQKVDVALARRPENKYDPKEAVQIIASINNGPVILLGHVPSERIIVDFQNPVWSDRPDKQFNTKTNKTTISEQMDRLGLHNIPLSAKLEKAAMGKASQEPYIILSAPEENWRQAYIDSLAKNNTLKPAVPFSNRQELFDRVVPSSDKTKGAIAFSNGELGRWENFVANKEPEAFVKYLNEYGKVIDLSHQKQITDGIDKISYLTLYRELETARNLRTLNAKGQAMFDNLRTGLNEFFDTHGRAMTQEFLGSPIVKSAVEGAVVPKPEELPKPAPVTSPQAKFVNVGKVAGTRQDIFINNAIAEGKQNIGEGDFSNFGNEKKLTGIAKQANNEILRILGEGSQRNDPRIQKIVAWVSKNTNRDYIRNLANRTPDQNEFVGNYVKAAKQLGFEPFGPAKKEQIHKEGLYAKYNEDELQDFKKLYVKSRQTPAEKKEFTVVNTPTGPGIKVVESRNYDPSSYMAERAQEHGLELQKINMEESDYRGGAKQADKQILELADNLDKSGYMFLGNAGQKMENAMALKYDSEAAKKLISSYDPNKHAPTDPDIIATYKELGIDMGNLTDKQKLGLVFATDVLHLDKNTSSPEFYKRLNILGDSSVKWDKEGQFRNYVLPGTTLREVMQKAFPGLVEDTPAYKEFLNRVKEDGAIFMFPEDMDQAGFDLGFRGKSWNKKGSITSKMPNGTLLVQKGNTGTMNELLQELFEKQLGLKLKAGRDMVSFGENIKMGKSGLIPMEGSPNIFYADIPKKDMRFTYKNPKEDLEGSFGVHLLGKFSTNDGINDELVNIFAPGAKKWKDTMERVILKGEDMKKVLEENYGRIPEESEYGKLKTMWAQNASRVALGPQFEKVMLKLFADTVVRNRDLRSAYMTIVPDMGYMKRGVLTMLQPDEIMMSREAVDNLKLQKSVDGNYHVLSAREPVTDKLAMSKQKVVIADDFGINTLGKDDIIPNLFDTYARKEGDHDGDAFMIYALIDKARQNELLKSGKALDGIPEEVANNIELERAAKGKETLTSGIENKKWPKYPITQEGILKIAAPATLAKKELGGISNIINIGKLLVDNQKSFDIKTKTYSKTVSPNMNEGTIISNKQLIQEALDAGKSPTFADRNMLERSPLYRMFTLDNPQDIFSLTGQLYDPQQNYMGAFQTMSKSFPGLEGRDTAQGYHIPGLIDTINSFNSTTPADPSLWHPLQVLFKALEKIPSFTLTNKQKWDSDISAREAFVSGENKIPEPPMTKEAKDFIDFVNKKRERAQQINAEAKLGLYDRETASDMMKAEQQFVRDKYAAELHNFIRKDLEAISWHLIADKGTNWYFSPSHEAYNNQTGYYVERFYDLFLPEQAQVYYKAQDKWFDKNVKPLVEKKLSQFPTITSEANGWVPPPTSPTPADLPNLLK